MSVIHLSFSIDVAGLRNVTDEYLHGLWHACQLNPAPVGDRQAGELVAHVTNEIVRRWLQQAPIEQFRHQPVDHNWSTLVRHGSWRGPGGAWLPHERADAPPPQT